MLTKIATETEVNGQIVSIAAPILGLSPKDSLQVISTKGLEAVDATLFIGDAAQDGGTYQGRRIGTRNVVITYNLNPNPALGETVAGLRALLYQAFFNPTTNNVYVKVDFYEDDVLTKYVVGYTEKMPASIFSNDTTVQISLICPDPFIKDNLFTSISDPSGWMALPFYYNGTAPAGIELEVKTTVDGSTPFTLNLNGNKMVLEETFEAARATYINTEPGYKALLTALKTDLDAANALYPDGPMRTVWEYLESKGQTKSLLGSLTTDSSWLAIRPTSSNMLKVYGDVEGDGAFSITKLQYVSNYWGM